MTFDQLALKAPKGQNTVLMQGKSFISIEYNYEKDGYCMCKPLFLDQIVVFFSNEQSH